MKSPTEAQQRELERIHSMDEASSLKWWFARPTSDAIVANYWYLGRAQIRIIMADGTVQPGTNEQLRRAPGTQRYAR